MTDDLGLVLVIDDDASLRASLSSLLRSNGFSVELFSSTAEYVQREEKNMASCILLDVRLQGASGLDFQEELQRDGDPAPIVMMTGHADVPMSVRAMKAGAVDFLSKPFREQDLLDAVKQAIERDRTRRARLEAVSDLVVRYKSLTERERQVMALAVSGLLNKQIAGEMEISEITVKIHRGNAMKKMKAPTFSDLVRMAQKLDEIAH